LKSEKVCSGEAVNDLEFEFESLKGGLNVCAGCMLTAKWEKLQKPFRSNG
jgi:hypothetical protein